MKVSSILSFKENGRIGYGLSNNNGLYVAKPYKSDSFTFTGNVSKPVEESLAVIQECLGKIEHYFSSIDGIKITTIRKNYPRLIPRKGSGLTFKVTEYDENLTVMRNNKDKRFLRFSVKNDIKDDFFIFDGSTLVNQTKSLKEKDVEEYVNIARKEIQNFAEYVSDSVTAKPVPKPIEKVKPKLITEKVLKVGIANYSNAPLPVQKIMRIFESDASTISKELKVTTSPTNNQILAISKVMQDGSQLSVTKGINTNYGDSLTYLTFRKISPDGTKSYMAVDLKYYKFLMLNRDFKPLIRNNQLYEYPETDVLKRHMNERLTDYVDELTKDILPKEVKVEPKPVEKKPVIEEVKVEPKKSEKPVKPQKEKPPRKVKPKEIQKPLKESETPDKEPKVRIKPVSVSNNIDDKDEIMQKIRIKAVQDAQEAANIYFETFKNEFQKNILEQFTKLQEKFAQMFKLQV